MKKMFALVLSALFLFSIAAPACAAEAGNGLVADKVWAGNPDATSYYLPDWAAKGGAPAEDSPYSLPEWATETGNGLVAERWIESGDSAAYYVSPGQTSHKKGDHSNGWYVRAEGVLGAAVTDKDGNVIEELPEVNDVCPNCRKGICSSSNLVLLDAEPIAPPLLSAIASPIFSRLYCIR